MTVRIVRIGAGLTAAAALIVGATACSAGQNTQTAEQVAAVTGASVDFGELQLRDVTVVFPGPDGYAAGENAPLTVRIFNSAEGPADVEIVDYH